MYQISVPFHGNNIVINFNQFNIHIVDSYKVKRKKDMKLILSCIEGAAFNKGIFYSRTDNSWIREWKSHNMLYKLGLFKSHTRDTDLEEKESIFRRIGYFVMTIFNWK